MKLEEFIEHELIDGPEETIIVTPQYHLVARELIELDGQFGDGWDRLRLYSRMWRMWKENEREAVCLTDMWEKGRITFGLAAYAAL